MNEEIDIILSRYFSGEATEKELQALDIWLSKSAENEAYFHQMSLLYQHVGATDDFPAIDTEKALQQFKNHIHSKKGLFYNTSFIWRAAAAIALLVVAAFAFYHFMQPSKTIHLLAVETQKEYTIFENANVTLFPGAEIVYNQKNAHQIQLKGKATFNIQSEDSKKLVVQAGETYIKDIGTVFSVDATNPESTITVTVSVGEVWFYTEHNTGVHLKAHEGAIYEVTSKQFKMIFEKDPNMVEEQQVVTEEEAINTEEQSIVAEKQSIIAAKQEPSAVVKTPPAEVPPARELVFHNLPLHEAVALIKTNYHVDIEIGSSELNNILLNVSFNKNESVEYILEVISATLSARVTKQNGVYIIK